MTSRSTLPQLNTSFSYIHRESEEFASTFTSATTSGTSATKPWDDNATFQSFEEQTTNVTSPTCESALPGDCEERMRAMKLTGMHSFHGSDIVSEGGVVLDADSFEWEDIGAPETMTDDTYFKFDAFMSESCGTCGQQDHNASVCPQRGGPDLAATLTDLNVPMDNRTYAYDDSQYAEEYLPEVTVSQSTLDHWAPQDRHHHSMLAHARPHRYDDPEISCQAVYEMSLSGQSGNHGSDMPQYPEGAASAFIATPADAPMQSRVRSRSASPPTGARLRGRHGTHHTCTRCNRTFGRSDMLRRHERESHGDRLRPFVCGNNDWGCRKRYKRYSSLKYHWEKTQAGRRCAAAKRRFQSAQLHTRSRGETPIEVVIHQSSQHDASSSRTAVPIPQTRPTARDRTPIASCFMPSLSLNCTFCTLSFRDGDLLMKQYTIPTCFPCAEQPENRIDTNDVHPNEAIRRYVRQYNNIRSSTSGLLGQHRSLFLLVRDASRWLLQLERANMTSGGIDETAMRAIYSAWCSSETIPWEQYTND